jgi:hypothetical protein
MCRSQQEIAEVRDLAADRLSIYHRPAGQPDYRQRASDDLPMEGEGHCWLVIYASRDEKRLAPLLYWNQGEAGVQVCTVDDETIDALSYFHVVDPVSLKPVTLFDRVQALLQTPDGPIEKAWARTALDFLDNPVLKRARTRSSRD